MWAPTQSAVPKHTISWLSSIAPEPKAAEVKSPELTKIGVPEFKFNSFEASSVNLPAISVVFLISGSFSLSIPNLFKIFSDHSNFPGLLSIIQEVLPKSLEVTAFLVHLKII